MAQHISINSFTQKKFTEIKQGIENAFTHSYGMKTSMRYIYNDWLTQAYNKPNIEVYTTIRNIPTGIVYNDNKATFEIHFNRLTKTVEEIYLVA